LSGGRENFPPFGERDVLKTLKLSLGGHFLKEGVMWKHFPTCVGVAPKLNFFWESSLGKSPLYRGAPQRKEWGVFIERYSPLFKKVEFLPYTRGAFFFPDIILNGGSTPRGCNLFKTGGFKYKGAPQVGGRQNKGPL